MSRLGRSLLLVVGLTLVFGYGVLTGRHRLFPYPQATSLYLWGRGIISSDLLPSANGRWHAARDGTPSVGAGTSHRERLRSLGYLQGSRAAPSASSANLARLIPF